MLKPSCAGSLPGIVGRLNMSDKKIIWSLKRVLIVALKVYAGFCTLLVTTCLICFVWAASTSTASGQVTEEDLKALGFTGADLKHELLRQNASQPNGAANRSQPIGLDTNRPPGAAGSSR
jgi:hypothetical protein